MLIDILLSLYVVGIIGAYIGVGSWMWCFNRKNMKKRWYIFIFAPLLPVVNYRMMWEGFSLYYEKTLSNERV